MRSLFINFLEYIKKNKFDTLCVFLIFILGIVLRVIALNNYGALTQDEPYSWRFASYNSILDTIRQIINVDVHMPLYFVLLNIWIKIFGDSIESLHYSSIFFYLPAIPIAYCVAKKLFNKTSAYFSIIFLTFNTFCIYYSVYVRFYALLIPLSILFSYLFVKMLEKFEKKYVISFIFVHCLMFYTFTLNIVLLFFTALIGLHYIITSKKDIKKYIKIYLVILFLSFPGVILFVSNIIATSGTICSHSEEFFIYSPKAIFDILENFFSNENYQILSKSLAGYRDYRMLLSNSLYFFLVGVPIFIGLFFFIKSLFSKNKKLYLFVVPSILTIITTLFLAKFDLMYYQTKYLIIVFPIILLATSYGFTLLKTKCLAIILFSLYMSINLGYTLTSYKSVLKLHNFDMGYMTSVFYYNNVKNDDLIISPFVPEVLRYFYKIGHVIPFAYDEGILIKDKKSLAFYFGDEEYKKINKNNILKYLDKYIKSDTPIEAYENNLNKKYISKMKKGQKLVIINGFEVTTGFCEYPEIYKTKRYVQTRKFSVIMKKCIRDTIQIADKYLKKVNTIRNFQQGYVIYIYEKE